MWIKGSGKQAQISAGSVACQSQGRLLLSK